MGFKPLQFHCKIKHMGRFKVVKKRTYKKEAMVHLKTELKVQKTLWHVFSKARSTIKIRKRHRSD